MFTFIKLTVFSGFIKDAPQKSAYVNFENVTYFNEWTRTTARNDLELINGRVQLSDVTTTVISFAAGLNEESDSIQVMESAEYIMEALRQ